MDASSHSFVRGNKKRLSQFPLAEFDGIAGVADSQLVWWRRGGGLRGQPCSDWEEHAEGLPHAGRISSSQCPTELPSQEQEMHEMRLRARRADADHWVRNASKRKRGITAAITAAITAVIAAV